MSLKSHALSYAARGWRVFPCVAGGKRPLTPNGFKSATTHEGVIEDWWRRNPTANIGLAIPEGMVVLDFDPRNGAPGLEAFAHTKAVRTPSGGVHLYYTVPGYEGEYRGTFSTGVDVKAPGKGYVLLPPSIISWGGGNLAQYVFIDDCRAVDIPEWVLTRIKREPRGEVGFSAAALEPSYFPWDEGTRYGLAALNNACARLLETDNGERNKRLFMETKDLLRLVNGGELRVGTLSQLRDAAIKAGLTYDEVAGTMKSAADSVGTEYRRAPAR